VIYLAIPIKHNNPEIEGARIECANRIAALFHDRGIPVFSPASHGGAFARHGSNGRGWDYWKKIDLPILTLCCSKMLIVKIPGWQESRGIQVERAAAMEVGIPIVEIMPHYKFMPELIRQQLAS